MSTLVKKVYKDWSANPNDTRLRDVLIETDCCCLLY